MRKVSKFIKINNNYVCKDAIESIQMHDNDSCYYVWISTGKFMTTINFTNPDDMNEYVRNLMSDLDE